MAFTDLHFFSTALQVQVSVWVILPEKSMGIGVEAGGEAALPQVLYLLHGYSDDHTIWLRRTSVERYAAQHNLAVVMPAVNHSFYTNEACGERYWDFVSEELPNAVQRFFRLSAAPEDTYVCGLSMGGYGAMKLALTYPERYAAAASFSGAVDIADMSHRTGERLTNMRRIFGDTDAVAGSDNDLFALLERDRSAPRRPRLYIACGEDDFLYHQHKKFWPAAKEAGFEVTHYEKPDTGHEWAFWDEQVKVFIDRYIR